MSAKRRRNGGHRRPDSETRHQEREQVPLARRLAVYRRSVPLPHPGQDQVGAAGHLDAAHCPNCAGRGSGLVRGSTADGLGPRRRAQNARGFGNGTDLASAGRSCGDVHGDSMPAPFSAIPAPSALLPGPVSGEPAQETLPQPHPTAPVKPSQPPQASPGPTPMSQSLAPFPGPSMPAPANAAGPAANTTGKPATP